MKKTFEEFVYIKPEETEAGRIYRKIVTKEKLGRVVLEAINHRTPTTVGVASNETPAEGQPEGTIRYSITATIEYPEKGS